MHWLFLTRSSSSCIATAASDDFSPLSSHPLTFLTDSVDEMEMCVSLAASTDDRVECEERFTVVLALSTPGVNLSLRNNSTAVILIDSDGMCLNYLESEAQTISSMFSCFLFGGYHGNHG